MTRSTTSWYRKRPATSAGRWSRWPPTQKQKNKTGRVFSSWALAREYGFTDIDGAQPHWGDYARKKYGNYKICDDVFHSYQVPGLIELMFPDWF